MKGISVILSVLNYDKNCKISINSIINSSILEENLFKELILVLGDIGQKEKVFKDYRDKIKEKFSLKIEYSKQGIYAAYNTGLSIAQGDYLLFIGGGEEINYEKKFFIKLKKAINLEFDAYIFNISFNSNKRLKELKIKDIKCPPHQTILYSNKLLKKIKIKYDQRLKIYSDAIFTTTYFKSIKSFTFLPYALVDFKEGGSGNSLKGLRLRLLDQLKILIIYRKNIKGFISFINYIFNEILYCAKILIHKN